MGYSLVDAILRAPVGLSLLGRLERGLSSPTEPASASLNNHAEDRIDLAVSLVETMPFGALIQTALHAALIDVGPWIGTAPLNAADGYREAERRAPIAEAIAHRFGSCLDRRLDLSAQQWWTSLSEWEANLFPLFQDFGDVLEAGQATNAGLWTVTDPPPETHSQLMDCWEMRYGPLTRWNLPVKSGARIFEITRPEGWAELVTTYPRLAHRASEYWELPSVHRNPAQLQPLLSIPFQHAAREAIRTHLVPDWAAVAEDYDAVHLTWAGFMTTEGFITDLGGGDVAMLRHWASERALWLADVFGEPRPLTPPRFSDATLPDGSPSVLPASEIQTRRRRDHDLLAAKLGRSTHANQLPNNLGYHP